MPERAFLLVLLFSIPCEIYAARVIPPGKEGYFISVIKPYDNGISDYTLKNISVSRDNVRYEFCSKECFYIVLRDKSDSEKPLAVSKNFGIYAEGSEIQNVDIRPLITAITENETGSIFEYTDDSIPPAQVLHSNVRIIYFLVMLLVLIFILSSDKKASDAIFRVQDKAINLSKKYYPVFFLIIIVFASYMRFRNICLPVVEEGSALRILFSYDSWIYNLFVSNDQRHPGLYFALLKPLVLIFENPGCAARIFSASLSVLSVAVIGFVVKDINCINSLLAMLLLSLHPEYIYRSREVTDISLFILMSLLSLYFLLRAEKSDRKLYKILFTFFTVLSCYSSYAAFVNLAGILFYLVIRRRIKVYFRYISAVLVFILSYVLKILLSLNEEFFSRSMAKRYPQIIWGET
ncbi:MAG: glycosyltransferase family 39 protein, partial [Deltaproteobacteria bacterium]|nr:glycosyltransferase family 39 protein [Deltaproteobacteria bacterium]